MEEIKEEYVRKNLDREASILTKLNHPNIVKLYEVVKTKELHCLSLELIRGSNMAIYLRKQKMSKISEQKARHFCFQILLAVEHMHNAKILHRDLKLENILVMENDTIKIIDFGLSNVYYPAFKLRTHCGSVEFAAPELFQNRNPYGAGVDMWSVGIILYILVMGHMPFSYSKTTKDTVMSRRANFYHKISQGLSLESKLRMKFLSCECCNLVYGLLQPDPFKRMRLKNAMCHIWFKSFEGKQEMMSREDSREKFHNQVIDYLSRQLATSAKQVETHVQNFRFDSLSAMYYMVLDALIQDPQFLSKRKAGILQITKRELYQEADNSRKSFERNQMYNLHNPSIYKMEAKRGQFLNYEPGLNTSENNKRQFDDSSITMNTSTTSTVRSIESIKLLQPRNSSSNSYQNCAFKSQLIKEPASCKSLHTESKSGQKFKVKTHHTVAEQIASNSKRSLDSALTWAKSPTNFYQSPTNSCRQRRIFTSKKNMSPNLLFRILSNTDTMVQGDNSETENIGATENINYFDQNEELDKSSVTKVENKEDGHDSQGSNKNRNYAPIKRIVTEVAENSNKPFTNASTVQTHYRSLSKNNSVTFVKHSKDPYAKDVPTSQLNKMHNKEYKRNLPEKRTSINQFSNRRKSCMLQTLKKYNSDTTFQNVDEFLSSRFQKFTICSKYKTQDKAKSRLPVFIAGSNGNNYNYNESKELAKDS